MFDSCKNEYNQQGFVGPSKKNPIKKKRILILVECPLGYGHVNRLKLIAEELARQGDYEITIATGDHEKLRNILGLEEKKGYASYIHIEPLPTLSMGKVLEKVDDEGNMQVRPNIRGRVTMNGQKAYVDDPKSQQQRIRCLRKILNLNQPDPDPSYDAVLIDMYPLGRSYLNWELEPLLKELNELPENIRPLIVTSIARDIFSYVPNLCEYTVARGFDPVRMIREYVDHVAVMGDENFIRVENSLFSTGHYPPTDWTCEVADKIHYCGYVTNKALLNKVEDASRSEQKEEPFVLVTSGGYASQDTHRFYKAVMRYIAGKRIVEHNIQDKAFILEDIPDSEQLLKGKKVKFVIPTGEKAIPYETGKEVDLKELLEEHRVELGIPEGIIEFTETMSSEDFLSDFVKAKLVLSQSGYNTTIDAIKAKKRAVFINRDTHIEDDIDEQKIRNRAIANYTMARDWEGPFKIQTVFMEHEYNEIVNPFNKVDVSSKLRFLDLQLAHAIRNSLNAEDDRNIELKSDGQYNLVKMLKKLLEARRYRHGPFLHEQVPETSNQHLYP